MSGILGIIPARFGSTRFPGKPLIDIGGKSMIQRVYEQASKAKLVQKLIVATDDVRIADHVSGFGGVAMITSTEHQSGTDRCAEVLLHHDAHFNVVINIQGDEPFINPEQIDLLAGCFTDHEIEIASLIKSIFSEDEIRNPNIVKVILNRSCDAIYFSRSPVPYRRNPEAVINYYKHIGIYGYRSEVLKKITKLPQGKLEKAESLEQLRWLENGYKIRLKETNMESLSVDTPSDLEKALALIRK